MNRPKTDHLQFIKLLIVLMVLMVGILSLRFIFENEYNVAIEFVKNNPDSELIFLGFFILSSVLSFPTLPLNVLAGLLYGTQMGALLVIVGAVVGSYLTYILIRLLKKKREPSLEVDSLYAKLARHEFDYKTIIFLRLNIFLPTFLVNTVLAGSKIGRFKFFVTALIGFTPFSFLIAYLGHLANGDMDVFYRLITEHNFLKTELF
ncbi:MAG: VTT domain-containing protein [Methylococcales bacterium]|nr:VTT domain-containing protein [Methylococcales bacterium]